jgi:hypothetical protein
MAHAEGISTLKGLNRGCGLRQMMQPFQGWVFLTGVSTQGGADLPWAIIFNPFGVKTKIGCRNDRSPDRDTKMSFMFEVFYQPPPDPHKEAALTARISSLGGI